METEPLPDGSIFKPYNFKKDEFKVPYVQNETID